jgi:UDP-galactose transporter B1
VQIEYLMQHPETRQTLMLFSLTSAIGQVFIFLTIKTFDSLILSTITTTRKFFTIVVSVLVHGHVLSLGQWTAVALVFLGLAADQVMDSYSKRNAKALHGDKHGSGSAAVAHGPDSGKTQHGK